MSQAAAMLASVKAQTMASRKRRALLSNIAIKHCPPPPPEQQPDWSSIHYDVLENILKYLQLVDLLRCRAVCTMWRSSTQSHISSSINSFNSSQQNKPPLILWYEPYLDHCANWFLDITRPRKNLYQFNRKSKQVLWRKLDCCVGFSYGWFLFSGKRFSNRLYLFHPLLFSTVVARFPRIKSPPPNADDHACEDDIAQAVLLSDPILTTGGNYGLLVIPKSRRQLLFAKCGATRFSELECHSDDDPNTTRWVDIIRVGNFLYGITTVTNNREQCRMIAWDCTDCTKPRQIVDFQVCFQRPGDDGCRRYLQLVESQGELLLVVVHIPDSRIVPLIMRKQEVTGTFHLYSFVRRPNVCRVYKMDFKEKEWVRMESLGDRALFVMQFQAMSVSTREFPQYRRNTVYFYHRLGYAGCSPVVGVYNLDDGSMEEIEVCQ